MNYIFVSDLDGTLLEQGKERLEQEVLEVIASTIKKGNIFVVASARGYNELKEIFAPILHDVYFICENGALLQFRGKSIYRQTMKKEKWNQIIEYIEDCGLEWIGAGIHTIYAKRDFKEVEKYRKKSGLRQMKIADSSDIQEEMLRISVFHTGRLDHVIEKKIKSILGNDGYISYQDKTWTDILSVKANKGRAFSWLLEELKLTKEKAVGFGDNLNDITMLDTVGSPYVMLEGREELKSLFSKQTDSVIKIIKQYEN